MDRWILELNCLGRNHSPPFNNPELCRQLELTHGDQSKLSVIRNDCSSAIAAQALNVPEIDKGPFVTSLFVDPSSISEDSYFCEKWVEFRKSRWGLVIERVRGNPTTVPPLLEFSFACDDPSLASPLMQGGFAQLDIGAVPTIWVRPDFPLPVQADGETASQLQLIGDQLLKQLPKELHGFVVKIAGPGSSLPNGQYFQLSGWEHPRFTVEREPYYDYWKLRAFSDLTDFGGVPPQAFARAPTESWLEWATVRYDDRTYRDFELMHLFAGVTLCHPALLAWREMFRRKSPIRVSADALAAVSRILLAWTAQDPYEVVGWQNALRNDLRTVGIPTDAADLEFTPENIRVCGRMEQHQLDALRVLVPRSRLTTVFILDQSPMDHMMLA